MSTTGRGLAADYVVLDEAFMQSRAILMRTICRAYGVQPWQIGLEPRERPVDRARRLRIERAMRLRARRASRRSRKASR